MTITEAPSARMTALAAWSRMQAVRAQLRADIATGDVQLIAADKTAILSLQQQITHSAHRIDVLV